MQLDDFFPYVLAEVPACPDITVRLALVQTAIDFCQKTLAWNTFNDPIRLLSGFRDYDLDAISQARVLMVESLFLGAREVYARTTQELQSVMPDWQTAEGSPLYYNSPDSRDVVRVYPKPNTTGDTLLAKVVYVPLSSATTLPDFLGNDHMDTIASGTKARLMMMPEPLWTNPAMSAYYQGAYSLARENERITQIHERTRGNLTVTPRRFQ